MTGKLTIVPTPIGNLGDMTLRAIEALKAADAVCAEDTRVTGKLLAALDISGKRLERLDENVMGQRAAMLVERVRGGEIIAYCSDAGMPGVSDPGLRLVAAMREGGLPVEVLPGASAAVTAYVASGTSAGSFYFGGFLPRKEKARVDTLLSLSGLDAALVFYESPNRLARSLEDIARVLPHREVCVCRELTKLHEEVVRGQAAAIAREFAEREHVKGEVVVVVDPPATEDAGEGAPDGQVVGARAQALLSSGLRPKETARALSEEFGLPRNAAYDLVLKVK